MYVVLDIALFVGGYVASIYSWTWLSTKIKGAEATIASLESTIAAIKAALYLVVPAQSGVLSFCHHGGQLCRGRNWHDS